MENAGLPRGNIMFSQDQIDFGFKLGNIYVVSYTCAKEPGEMVQEAVSVTLEKMHPCADYAKSGAFWGRWSCWPCSAC